MYKTNINNTNINNTNIMKLIIVEGIDGAGKDTLIRQISTLEPNNIIRHFSFPKGNSNTERIKYQVKSFHNEFTFFKETLNNKAISDNSIMIWNRSHIGEMVYGTLYRQYNPEDWIINKELEFNFHKLDNIYLIRLDIDAEFACSNDDGESFTSDVQSKKQEIALFKRAIDKSLIKNKLTIKVDEKGTFRNTEEIRREVFNFIGY